MTILYGEVYKSENAWDLLEQLGADVAEYYAVLTDEEKAAVVEMHNELCADWDGEPITVADLADPPYELREYYVEYLPHTGAVILPEVLERRDQTYIHLADSTMFGTVDTVVELDPTD